MDLPRAHDALGSLMGTLLSALLNTVNTTFPTRTSLALENAALRQHLTIYQRAQTRVRFRAWDRFFWVILRKL